MSQTNLLYNLMRDNEPHRTDEIVNKVYGQGLSLARVGARIYDLKKKYGVDVKGWHDPENPALYWYQLKTASQEAPQRTQPDRVDVWLSQWKPEVKLKTLW